MPIIGLIVCNHVNSVIKNARKLADELRAARAQGLFKISHFLHLRAEICSETLLQELAAFTTEDRVGIVSLMDHTPFIVASYATAAVVLGWCAFMPLLRLRRLRAQLAARYRRDRVRRES